MQRVSSSHGSAIIGNLDGIVERIQVDAVDYERHLGCFQPVGTSYGMGRTKGVVRGVKDRRGGVAVHLRSAQRAW
jgi:hypothetical protein